MADEGEQQVDERDEAGQRPAFAAVDLGDADVHGAYLHGLDVKDGYVQGVRMRGMTLVDIEIAGELQRVVVNGVDIGPLVEAELDRRTPDRAKMRPDDADGFREAWTILGRLWDETIERARSLPGEALHRRVGGEWSFIDTLRHLNFASAAWVGRMVLGEPSPWHPLDLPWENAPGWDPIHEDLPGDRDARPPLDTVLAVREGRRSMVSTVLESLTDEQLASQVSQTAPGWPRYEGVPLRDCLQTVLTEEWEHRRYAERDLAVLEGSVGP